MRTNVTKNIRPHLWRHARATELAEHLTDAQRCKYFGWVDGSEMARIYTHLVDTDRTILEMNGLIKKEKDTNGQFNAVICPRCDTKNPYGARICAKCFLALDQKTIEDFDKKKTIIARHVDDMLEDEDTLRRLIDKLSDQLEQKTAVKKP